MKQFLWSLVFTVCFSFVLFGETTDLLSEGEIHGFVYDANKSLMFWILKFHKVVV